MNLDQFLFELSQTNRIVLSDSRQSLTGKELAEKIYGTARGLSQVGIKNKRICLLRMTNDVDAIVTLFATILNQAVVFISNPHDPIAKVCETLEKFQVFALISDRVTSITAYNRLDKKIPFQQGYKINETGLFASLIQSHNKPLTDYDPQMGDADLAIFSSGSTGEPKAILHKIESLFLNAWMHNEAIGINENEKIGICLPMYYSYGLVANLFGGLIAKASIHLSSQIGAIDSDWLQHNKISALSITPFLARKIQHNIPCLSKITIGGDSLYSKRASRLLDILPDCSFFSTYGLTEAGPRVSTCHITRSVIERNFIIPLGKPLSYVSLALANNSDRGELLVYTPTHMLGYYFGNKSGFSSLKGNCRAINTGDLYEKKQEDFFFIGRKKKIIFQGGEKLFPLVIESAINDMEGVLDVVVSGALDEKKGQIAKAFIVTHKNINIQDIRKYLRRRFSNSAIPEQFEFVDSIPRTQTGKIQAQQYV